MEVFYCQACLSKDRRMFPQEKIKDLLEDIHILEIMYDKNGVICWECYQIILKFSRFKLQVCQAQKTMHFLTEESRCYSNLSTVKKKGYDFKFVYHSDPLTSDIEIKSDIKLELSEIRVNDSKTGDIKQLMSVKKSDLNDGSSEIDMYEGKANDDINNDTESINDDYDGINDVSSNEAKINDNPTVYADILEPKLTVKKERHKSVKAKGVKRKSVKVEFNEEELNEKFAIIVYTEEEMQKLREEKRSHPNFKKIPYKCESCVLGFTKKENLDVHLEKNHNQSNLYTCAVCLSRYSNKGPLSRHIRSHYARYKCTFCAYETREGWAASRHCRVTHASDATGRLHCPHCGKETSTKEELSEHIRTQHVLYCNECGEKFKGKHTLRTHMSRIHGVKREFVCDICNKPFKTKTRLESHMVTHNSALAKKLAFCVTCQVQYKNIYVYRNHLKNSANHSERAYPCPECKKKFVSNVYLKKHYNFYHLQKSQFNCDICNKLFISDWRLKNHKQKHHGLSRPRDHTCNICGKKFFTLSTLRGHQLTHSPRRSFLCEGCGDTFRQRPALYTHVRRVHGETNGKRGVGSTNLGA